MNISLRRQHFSLPPQDGDQAESMPALRRITEIFAGVAQLARSARLNANTLCRARSSKGNPELKGMRPFLQAMDMQLTVRPLREKVA